MTAPLVAMEDLRVAFDGVPVLHGVDLSVLPGESLGLVGESGSGKSVTWLAALGLLPGRARVSGSVRLGGEELLGAAPAVLDRVRGGRIATVPQDPASALNPVHRIGTQVAEAVRLHRELSGAAARAEAVRLLDQVGLPDPQRRYGLYPHEMSGGQNQRAMIATALAGQPELLVADEPTTALDVTVQAGILDLLRRLQAETGMALVLVMYAGRIVEEAPAEALFAEPLHPYAEGLLAAIPAVAGPRRRLRAIPGTVPDPALLPPGCAFAPRCDRAVSACQAAVPTLAAVRPGRRAACFRVGATAQPAACDPAFA